jgi:hypothetical protein
MQVFFALVAYKAYSSRDLSRHLKIRHWDVKIIWFRQPEVSKYNTDLTNDMIYINSMQR